MGAIFAIQVRTGFEIKAKEMLKHVLERNNDKDVKGIYALETHTAFIHDTCKSVDYSEITEEDISKHLLKERYSSMIANKRLQLESIERYDDPEYRSLQKQCRKEINQLQKEASELRKKTKSIHSVMSGYILVELKSQAIYLSNMLWSLFKSVPLVNRVLSTTPIPEEEAKQFFNNMEGALTPEVEIQFGKEMEYEEIDNIQHEALVEANEKDKSKEEQDELFGHVDEQILSVIEKMKKIISQKNGTSSIPFFKKINAFVRRGRKVVKMPLHYLDALYPHNVGVRMTEKDFLDRLNNLINRSVVMVE